MGSGRQRLDAEPDRFDFNFETMRMEMVSFSELVLNPVAQVKLFTPWLPATCGAMFVLGISSYYLLKGRDIAFAKRSFAIAASFGMAAILSVIVLGDESGHEMGDVQKNQTGRYRSGMGHPAGTGVLHPVRHSRSGQDGKLLLFRSRMRLA